MRIVAETTSLKRKYEQEVASRSEFGFFEQLWVQDALHVNWCYLQNNTGELLLRLPFSRKFGPKAYLQPLFMRELCLLQQAQKKEAASSKKRGAEFPPKKRSVAPESCRIIT